MFAELLREQGLEPRNDETEGAIPLDSSLDLPAGRGAGRRRQRKEGDQFRSVPGRGEAVPISIEIELEERHVREGIVELAPLGGGMKAPARLAPSRSDIDHQTTSLGEGGIPRALYDGLDASLRGGLDQPQAPGAGDSLRRGSGRRRGGSGSGCARLGRRLRARLAGAREGCQCDQRPRRTTAPAPGHGGSLHAGPRIPQEGRSVRGGDCPTRTTLPLVRSGRPLRSLQKHRLRCTRVSPLQSESCDFKGGP